MIAVTVVINGESKIILKGPEPKDNTALQLVLGDVKLLKVAKVNDDWVLTPEKPNEV